jgi:hypothetical protein
MNVEMKLDVKVNTYVNGNLIVQDVSSAVDDKTSQLSRQVYDTSEKGFRDALVEMGWTPPDVAYEILVALRACEYALLTNGLSHTASVARGAIEKVEARQ